MRLGSDEHLQLLCREFVATHDPFDPAALPWPELSPADVDRLRSLPFWDEAIRTERRTGAKVRAYAATEHPPVLRDAVALQGFEESRHARLLETVVTRYGVAVDPGPQTALPTDLERAFMRTGYGECIDSFFAFGLFALARESAFLPPALLDLLEPIVQEEARHILFHVNWVAYKREQQAPLGRAWHRARCVAALSGAAFDRARSALAMARNGGSSANGVDGADAPSVTPPAPIRDGFTASSARDIAADVSVRGFLTRCLEENDRRFAPYDPRLLRPRLMPALARTYLRVTQLAPQRRVSLSRPPSTPSA